MLFGARFSEAILPLSAFHISTPPSHRVTSAFQRLKARSLLGVAVAPSRSCDALKGLLQAKELPQALTIRPIIVDAQMPRLSLGVAEHVLAPRTSHTRTNHLVGTEPILPDNDLRSWGSRGARTAPYGSSTTRGGGADAATENEMAEGFRATEK